MELCKAKKNVVIFSDIDGTLVHYNKKLAKLGRFCEQPVQDNGEQVFKYTAGTVIERVVPLPPSLTGAVGFISAASHELVRQMRSEGCHFVIVTGARTLTTLQRLPYLPAADAVVTENGGRIFLLNTRGLSACPFHEDFTWRKMHGAAVGGVDQEALAPEARTGPLWDAYRALAELGWQPDAAFYSTLVRVRSVRDGCDPGALAALLAALPPCLQSAANLEYLDIFPATAGKENAARYLASVFGADIAACASLGDDDNDLALAGCVGRAFIPEIGAASMQQAIDARPEHFEVSAVGGFAGTEAALAAAAQWAREAAPATS